MIFMWQLFVLLRRKLHPYKIRKQKRFIKNVLFIGLNFISLNNYLLHVNIKNVLGYAIFEFCMELLCISHSEKQV